MRVLDWVTGDRDELTVLIRSLLTAGFWEFDDLEEWVAAWLDDSGVVAAEEAAALLRAMWDERVAEQSGWTDSGDYGRLRAAFDELEAEGIVARMCFECCQNCGLDLIAAERTADSAPADAWYPYRQWAYTFFHERDARGLGSPGGTLYLAYGPYRPHPDLPAEIEDAARRGEPGSDDEVRVWSEVRVADRIVAVTRSNGLEVRWSGSPADRVALTIGEWRKPLPGADGSPAPQPTGTGGSSGKASPARVSASGPREIR